MEAKDGSPCFKCQKACKCHIFQKALIARLRHQESEALADLATTQRALILLGEQPETPLNPWTEVSVSAPYLPHDPNHEAEPTVSDIGHA